MHAVELDDAAFGWARRNVEAAEQSLARRITLHHGDVNGCLPELDGQVDLVISNPPYVPLGASVRDPEVAEYDPARALWAGADGLDVIRTVERVAARLLRPDGLVVVEHADEQWAEAPRCFPEEAGWTEVRDHRDLADRPRFVTARKEASPL